MTVKDVLQAFSFLFCVARFGGSEGMQYGAASTLLLPLPRHAQQAGSSGLSLCNAAAGTAATAAVACSERWRCRCHCR